MDSSSFVPKLKPSEIYLPKCWNNFLDDLSKPHDLGQKLLLVNKVKFRLEREAARLAKVDSFGVAMELITNTIISVNEQKEGIMKDMKKFETRVTYADMSKGKGVFKEGTLQGRWSNHEGSSSSLFNRQLQEVPPYLKGRSFKEIIASPMPYLNKGRSFKEIIASPMPSLAIKNKDTPPNCPYNRIKERLFGKGEASSGPSLFNAENRQSVEVVTSNSSKRKRAVEVPVNKDNKYVGVQVNYDALPPFAKLPLQKPNSAVSSSQVQPRPSLLDQGNHRGGRV